MFHIFSQKMPSVSSNNAAKNINFDFTYVEQTDSVSMLATVAHTESARPMEVSVDTGDTTYNFIPELVYAEPKRNNMEYRLKIVLPFNVWENMYDSPRPYRISFNFKSDIAPDRYTYGFPVKKWKSKQEKMTAIIGQIKLNTGKL